MAVQSVKYAGGTQTELPSKSIWADCPIAQIHEDPCIGYGIYDNFLDFGATATAHLGLVYEGSCTMGTAAKPGGGLAVFGTTDNEEAAIQRGAGFVIAANKTDTTAKKLWFECCVKRSVIVTDKGAFFVGLAGEGAGIADFIADGGTDISDVDVLGFFSDPVDDVLGSHIHTITQKTGAAYDTIVDTFATVVADTYVKLGFVYDPSDTGSFSDTQRIKFYLDGVEQSTYVGEDDGDQTVYCGDTTNFPGGEEMGLLLAVKNQHADDFTTTLKWWRCYQVW